MFAAPHSQANNPDLRARQDKEGFALRASVEDQCKNQYSLDFQGRKHVDTSEPEYKGYALQEEPPTSSDTFDLPGLASASELRAYLQKTLLPSQIINEYGDECDLSEVSLDHLAVLQAKLWTKAANARSPTKSTSPRPSRAQVLVAGHVTKISQLLEGKQE